ncbi:DUF2283 domain-containing protein [Candidatus Nitrospira inopinata]|uniref:DUF2283 domain-containing protein n=1 Tax=Candidatus Nitrospira inopinata TaxID=1715989 RepID=UPI0009E6CBDB
MFNDTDPLDIEFKTAPVSGTRDLDADTQLDIDKDGNICAITIEPRSPTPLHTWTIRSCRHKPHDISRGRQPPTRPRWLAARTRTRCHPHPRSPWQSARRSRHF